MRLCLEFTVLQLQAVASSRTAIKSLCYTWECGSKSQLLCVLRVRITAECLHHFSVKHLVNDLVALWDLQCFNNCAWVRLSDNIVRLLFIWQFVEVQLLAADRCKPCLAKGASGFDLGPLLDAWKAETAHKQRVSTSQPYRTVTWSEGYHLWSQLSRSPISLRPSS